MTDDDECSRAVVGGQAPSEAQAEVVVPMTDDDDAAPAAKLAPGGAGGPGRSSNPSTD